MSATATAPFARCSCGSCVIAEKPCEEHADLLLQGLRCERCGRSPRRTVQSYLNPPERGPSKR
jgi:hypothetical protein